MATPGTTPDRPSARGGGKRKGVRPATTAAMSTVCDPAVESDLAKARVLIYGLGRSGLAAAQALTRRGVPIGIYDDRALPDLASLAPGVLWAQVPAYAGTLPDEALARFDTVVISPGVPSHSPTLHRLAAARMRIVSEIELAYWLARAPIVAVTGTNGKTTTATLIDRLLVHAGLKSQVTGNIGYPFTQAVEERRELDHYVVECSSFQLDHIERFHPHVAVFTSFAANHLDWHGGQDAYLAAKLALTRNMGRKDAIAYPVACPELARGLAPCRARHVTFGAGGVVALDASAQAIEVRSGRGRKLWLDLASIRRSIAYQLENVSDCVLATAATAVALEVPPSALETTLRRFTPLPHRLEPVGVKDGVTYVNDSKATSVDAAMYALSRQTGPVVLILGGRNKGLSFDVMSPLVREKAKAVIVYGEARATIQAALTGSAPIRSTATLDEAVGVARKLAAAGEVVLFSPACASFDAFTSYEERGEAFRKAVRSL